MCWAEKCCYYVPLHLACVILGVTNFVISTAFAIASLVCYFSEEKIGDLKNQPHFVAEFLGLDLKMSTVNIILTIITIISVLWMMFSVLLIFGITKSRPNMLLSYFSFGIMLTILGQLAALLLLLSKCWGLAFTLFFSSLINIHYLVVVHTAYELMLKGNDFRFRRQIDEDDDTLADCFDESVNI